MFWALFKAEVMRLPGILLVCMLWYMNPFTLTFSICSVISLIYSSGLCWKFHPARTHALLVWHSFHSDNRNFSNAYTHNKHFQLLTNLHLHFTTNPFGLSLTWPIFTLFPFQPSFGAFRPSFYMHSEPARRQLVEPRDCAIGTSGHPGNPNRLCVIAALSLSIKPGMTVSGTAGPFSTVNFETAVIAYGIWVV